MVIERQNRQMASEVGLMQLAIASVLSKEADKELQKTLKILQEGG